MNEILSYVLWGFFGLLLLGIFLGVLWGAIRGWKRAAFRLGTLVLAIPLAILLAPVIANPLGGIRIGGYTISGLILGNMDGAMGTAAQEFTQLEAFLLALPIAIMSLLVFIVLLYFFRFLTWVIYAIFANKVAPRRQKVKTGERTANGMAKFEVRDARPTGVSRLLGGLIGAGQGILLFFLLMIPINGVLTMANEVTTYQPDFATADVRLLDEDVSPLANVFEEVVNFNDQVRRHPFGIAMRFTGMTVTSGPMFEYISTVRTPRGMPNVNLRRDAIQVANIYTDFVAIHQNFFDADGDTRDFAEVMESEAFAPYWNGMRGLVNRVFDISLFRLFVDATSDLATFIRDAEILEDEDMPGDLSLDDFLADLAGMTGNALRADILSLIGIVQDVFSYNATLGGTVWSDIYAITEGDNPIMEISNLGDESIDVLGGILNTLTNEFGFRMTLRSFIAELLIEALDDDSGILGAETTQVVNDLVYDLRDPEFNNFNWTADLRAIRATIKILDFINDGGDIIDLVNIIFGDDSGLLAALQDSQILGPLVVAQIQDLANDLADGTSFVTGISLNSDPEYFADTLAALSIMADAMTEILPALEYGNNLDGSDIFDALGDLAALEQLSTLSDAVTITLDSATHTQFTNALLATLDPVADAGTISGLLAIFVV